MKQALIAQDLLLRAMEQSEQYVRHCMHMTRRRSPSRR